MDDYDHASVLEVNRNSKYLLVPCGIEAAEFLGSHPFSKSLFSIVYWFLQDESRRPCLADYVHLYNWIISRCCIFPFGHGKVLELQKLVFGNPILNASAKHFTNAIPCKYLRRTHIVIYLLTTIHDYVYRYLDTWPTIVKRQYTQKGHIGHVAAS